MVGSWGSRCRGLSAGMRMSGLEGRRMEPVRADEFKVRVVSHGWCVQESDEALVPVPFPDDSPAGGFLAQFERRLDFCSAGHTHYAVVTVEHWGAEPEPDRRTVWDEVAEAVFVSASGVAAIWSDGRHHELTLLAPGTWRVRAYCAGRAEVAQADDADDVADGIEVYVLQFWPQA